MNTSLRFYSTHKEGARCCNWFRAEAEKQTHLRRRDTGVSVQKEAEGRGPACPRDGTGWAHPGLRTPLRSGSCAAFTDFCSRPHGVRALRRVSP